MERDEIEKLIDKLDSSKVLDVKVKEELEKSFIAYAMAVNVSRAIPDVRDGMKPVHRRIIYAMGSNLGLYNDKPTRKCATIVGEVMGKFHPHGDAAIYDALVRLAQDFTINCPLVEGQGNFGSVDGDPPAASRYTEAKLSKIAGEMLNGINQETVDFIPNFDGREMQPVVLPSRFPNLLVNGSDGIAVGMATNVPPHNLCEVINGVIALIDNPDITIPELMEYIPAPDFPTKGLVIGSKGIKDMYETGKGSFIIRAKTEIEEENDRQKIIITEIPYQVNKAKLIIQIADMVKSKRLEGIADIKEESDREGMRIVIDVKKDANAQVVLNNLFKHTQLQISFGAINLALVNGTPKVLNLKEILVHYLNFQKEVIIRRTKFELEKAEARAHILRGLVIAQANIDEVIRQIKLSNDKQDAVERLTRLFNLDEKQANAILDMRLQKLTGLEVEKLKAELEEVEGLIRGYKEILASELRVLEIIKGDLIEIKTKYGVPRKTEISFDFTSLDIGDLIPRQTVVLSLTHSGYIKRMPVSEYKSQHRGGMGVVGHKTKEEDFVENIYVTSSHDNLLCFSTKGRVYTIKAYEVPEAQKQAKGRAMVNLLQVDKDERITTIIPLSGDEDGNLMMATRQGLIKKTPISEFASIRKGGKIAIKLNDDDELIGVYLTNGNNEVLIASSEGKCIRFNENTVRKLGRDTMGVKSMKLNEGEYIVDMAIITPNSDMLTISEYGYGKRTNEDEYRLQGRNGKGIKAGVFNEQTGRLVNLKQVSQDDDIMLIADDGVVIRVSSQEISKISRNTKGVRIMKMKEGSKIVCVAVTKSDKSQDELAETLEEEVVENIDVTNIVEENIDNVDMVEESLDTTEDSVEETTNDDII